MGSCPYERDPIDRGPPIAPPAPANAANRPAKWCMGFCPYGRDPIDSVPPLVPPALVNAAPIGCRKQARRTVRRR